MSVKGGRKASLIILFSFAAVMIGIFSGLIIVSALGGNIINAFVSIFTLPASSQASVEQVVVRFVVLYTMSLGISLALKANLWNIGSQGQFIVGMVMVFVAYEFLKFLPSYLLFASMILLSVVGGVIWILAPALLRVRFGANEIVITLLLNVVALYFGTYMINGPIKGTQSFGYPITDTLPVHLTFPQLSYGITSTLPLTVAIGAAMYFLIERTTFGIHARVVGESLETANYAGINSRRIMVISLLVSGALSGLAGSTYVMGYLRHLDAGQFDTSFGLLALIASMIGMKNMIGSGIASAFIAYITLGIEEMAVNLNIPTSVVFAIEGIILVGILISNYLQGRFEK